MDYSFQNTPPPGDWIEVTSSWVAAVRWLPPSRLEIRTKAGKVLPYDAPEAELKRLLEAGSVGTYVNRVIKIRYPFQPS